MVVQTLLTRLADKKPKIGVVGDAMIDEYIPVTANRISPEFPNPITQRDRSRPIIKMPGGAANVAHQYKNLTISCELISTYDKNACQVFSDKNIKFKSYSYRLPSDYFIPIKTRYYVDDFPYSRHDDELSYDDFGKLEELSNYITNFPETHFDALILSDYHKGFFHENHLPSSWIGRAPLTIVDPKTCPICRWKGCTVFKPNAKEAEAISGRSKWQDQADYFLRVLRCQHVVITQGGNGVVAKSRDGSLHEYRPNKTTSARSVIGAGDCFLAFLTLSLAVNIPIDQAIELAFKAGAVYVQDIHNKPITPHDLLKSEDPFAAKYYLPEIKDNEKWVFTNGCFDLLHPGHIETLKFAKSKGSRLIVGVNSDASVKRLKGESRPIRNLEDRMAVLAALDFVDHVCSFDEDTPLSLIERINPDVIVKGGDYQGQNVIGGDNREVFIAPYLAGKSTTSTIDIIASKQC